MGPWQRILAGALSACALACAFCLPGRALASVSQQSILMDDDELIYASPEHVISRLQEIAALGVDRVKVSVVWNLVAPNPSALARPSFDATDPAQYPPHAWDRYDLITSEARALGLGVYFQLDPQAPNWAQPPHQVIQGPVLSRAPKPSEYRQFVEAVGRRYSGTYTVSSTETSPTSADLLGVHVPTGQTSSVSTVTLPRVDYWGVWNEPNERSWLSPLKRSLSHHRTEYLQPLLYREVVGAAHAGLDASDHTGDTVLIGETANVGILSPGTFIRGVYCVDTSNRPLHGSAAQEFGCPSGGNRAAFARANPGLFDLTGWAHHPYLFDVPPNARDTKANTYTLGNLNALERLLDAIFATYGRRPAGGVPLYMTEWGYKTSPPNPFVHTSLGDQAAWLNQGEFMTWNDSYVHALTQFELVDSPPKPNTKPGTSAYWSTFQTGLLFRNGSQKPSYSAFRIPVWVPHARHGSRVAVWGQLRPADHASLQYGVIEFRARGSSDWNSVDVAQTSSPEGFLLAHVSLPGPGALRLAWVQPGTGTEYDSRSVTIS